MVDPILYDEGMFVVLEDHQGECFLTPEELTTKLAQILEHYTLPLPRSLDRLATVTEKAQYLRDNHCELEQEDGGFLEWYAVRLEK